MRVANPYIKYSIYGFIKATPSQTLVSGHF